jgi:hypothetical protein
MRDKIFKTVSALGSIFILVYSVYLIATVPAPDISGIITYPAIIIMGVFSLIIFNFLVDFIRNRSLNKKEVVSSSSPSETITLEPLNISKPDSKVKDMGSSMGIFFWVGIMIVILEISWSVLMLVDSISNKDKEQFILIACVFLVMAPQLYLFKDFEGKRSSEKSAWSSFSIVVLYTFISPFIIFFLSVAVLDIY